MPEKVVIDGHELWHGDCREVLPLLAPVDLAALLARLEQAVAPGWRSRGGRVQFETAEGNFEVELYYKEALSRVQSPAADDFRARQLGQSQARFNGSASGQQVIDQLSHSSDLTADNVHHPIAFGIKSVAAYYIVRSFGHGHDQGLTIAASLAQIGEFSFILISMGVHLAIVPTEARDLVVAGAMISILANPFLFHLLDKRAARKAGSIAPDAAEGGGMAVAGEDAVEPAQQG